VELVVIKPRRRSGVVTRRVMKLALHAALRPNFRGHGRCRSGVSAYDLVRERGGGAASTIVALDELLVDAKLAVPRPRPGSVSRADLIEKARGSGCRVVGVTAPAGYGKSTFLTQWAHTEDRRIAWVSLDRFDNDPAVLLVLLASTFARSRMAPPA
jgi:hypothetical protein